MCVPTRRKYRSSLSMNKVIILIAILVAAFAYTEATRCRSHCSKNVRSQIACIRQGSICRKIRQCALDGENCRRRLAKQPRLIPTHSALCRNIKGSEGQGRCAIKKRVPRTVHPRPCHHSKCPTRNQKFNCYSTRANKCQLLSSCQVQHANCRRARGDLLEWVDLRRCTGMKPGQKLAKCGPGPRRS